MLLCHDPICAFCQKTAIGAFARLILTLDLILYFVRLKKAMRHCRFAFSDPRAMPRSMVERFQSKLGAVGLFVGAIRDAAERVKQSSVQSDSLIAFLQQEKRPRQIETIAWHLSWTTRGSNKMTADAC